MSNRKYTVYSHTSPSGKVYVGITKQRPTARWERGEGYKYNTHFYNAIQKYGWDNFEHRVLYTGLSKEEAEATEIRLIEKFDLTNRKHGYNRDLGGNLRSEETIRKCAEANSGEKSYWYGKKHSEEYKRKMSESCKGKASHPMTEEHKERLRQLSLGRAWTQEQRDKIMASRTKYYAEHKVEKKPKPKKERKDVCEVDGIRFKSAKECGEYLGLCGQQVNAYLRGSRKMPQKYADRNLRYVGKETNCIVSDGKKTGRPVPTIMANGVVYKSQRECAKALGVSATTLSAYLRGERKVDRLKDVVFSR